MQDQCWSDARRALEPFTPETSSRWRWLRGGMNRQKRERALRRPSAATRIGASASGRWIITNRPAGERIARQARIQFTSVAPASTGENTRACSRLPSGETRTVPRSKNGGLVHDAIGCLVGSPASRRSRGFKTSSLKRARAGLEVRFSQHSCRPAGRDRDRFRRDRRTPARVHWSAPARPRRRPRRRRRSAPRASLLPPQEGRVRADPVSAPWLDEGESALEPPVLGSPSAIVRSARATAFSHRAALQRGPPRRWPAAACSSSRARRPESGLEQEAERSFYCGHVLVGHEKCDTLSLQDGFDDADKYQIVGAQDFDQGGTPSAHLPRRLPVFMVEAQRLAKGKMRPWGSCRSDRRKVSRPPDRALTTLVANGMARVNQTILSTRDRRSR